MSAIDAMIIDDDLLQLHLLAEHCAALGRRSVLQFSSAEDALGSILSGRGLSTGTVLILDLKMPRLDGVEMLRQLKLAKFPGRLLLASGEGPRLLEAAARVARAMGLAVAGALTKPATRDALRAILAAPQEEAVAQQPAMPGFTADEVKAALSRGEIEIHYQPKVFVADCAPAGFEALMRWRHPLHGLLQPASFLPVIEAEGLLSSATRWAVRRVLDDLRQGAVTGLHAPVAINVAISDFERPTFCDELTSLLRLHKSGPRDIHLEVTERGVSRDATGSLQSMSRLKLQGLTLAVDDFGTGEASLKRLRDFPFDYIKIDRCFVHGAASDPASRAIFDACAAMAFQLDLGVVAEGVETEEDWHFVRRRRCEQAQGYFVGRPMPVSELKGWMKAWNDRRFSLMGVAS